MLLIASITAATAQNIQSYVKQNTVPIKTISPDSLDFSDLEAIGSAIGDSRIVMLGEQDHGDAPAYLAKTRLIKYLHEKKGFNVLAFESDFFGLTYGWDAEPKSVENVIRFEQSNIFPVWTACPACRDLFKNYLPGTQSSAKPMQLAGFDNQMLLYYSLRFLSAKFDSVLQSHNLPVTKEVNYTSEIIPFIDSCRKKLKDKGQYDKQLMYINTIKEQLGKFLTADNIWMMVVDNLISESNRNRNIEQDPVAAFNERDMQMAKNLLWLVTVKYPNERIIVWAQNGHISKDAGHYGNYYTDRYRYMGSVLENIKDPALKTYSLGFSSYNGSAGRVTTSKTEVVKDPKKNGFETWIPEHYDFAFTDFGKFNKENPGDESGYFMKGHGHQESIKTTWHHKFDGIFFIREMYSCR